MNVPLESYLDGGGEEGDDASLMPSLGRLSALLNEDDYDYAIELVPDEEYRKAAKILGNISDFEDADTYIESLLTGIEEDEDQEETSHDNSKGDEGKSRRGLGGGSREVESQPDELSSSKSQSGRSRSGSSTNRDEATPRKSPNKPNSEGAPGKDNSKRHSPLAGLGRIFGWAARAKRDKDSDDEEDKGAPAKIGEIQMSAAKAESRARQASQSDGAFVSPFASPIRAVSSADTTPATSAPKPSSEIEMEQTGGPRTPGTPASTDGDTPSLSAGEAIKIISRREFLQHIGVLAHKKRWVDKAARRSSMGFESKYAVTDKAVMDAFMVAMSAGVHARRHQSSKLSEVVRLSSADGCRSIQWGKLIPTEYAFQRQKEGVNVAADDKYARMLATSQSLAHRHEAGYPGSSWIDCCCEDGDDFEDSVRDRHLKNSLRNNDRDVASTESTSSSAEEHLEGLFHNFGYKYTGSFKDVDIIAVHPAVKEDPTAIGSNGTAGLRDSRDAYNAALSFSVVVRTTISSVSGYMTLDLECEAEETYCLLVQGFNLLCAEASVKEAERLMHLKSTTAVLQETGAAIYDGGHHLWHWAYGRARDYTRTPAMSNPAQELFAASAKGLMERIGMKKVNDSDPTFTMQNRPAQPQLKRNDSESSNESSSGKSPINKFLPPAQFLGWKSAGTQIWARLKMAGLEVKCVFSWDLRRVILKVRCPQWRLEEVAEFMHLKLRNRDGTIRRFKVSRRDTFLPDGQSHTLFRSSERQQIIDHILCSKIKDGGAELGEDTVLGAQIRQRFPLHMQARLEEIKHTWVTFWRQEMANEIAPSWSPCSVPIRVTFRRVMKSVKYTFANILVQPLDSIAEYYGESVAFYFAYLAFYTRWLIPPSILGFIVFCYQVKDMQLDHWMCMPYSILVMIWTCFLMVFWRQRSSALAYRWGVLDYEVQETERPQFRGKRYIDKHTLETRKYYPMWKRISKYFVSSPLLIGTFMIMLAIMSTVFTTQDRVLMEYKNGEPITYFPEITLFEGPKEETVGHRSLQDFDSAIGSAKRMAGSAFTVHVDTEELKDPDFWAVTFFYPSLYGIITNVLSALFNLLAVKINDFENHRTQSQYTNHLVLKIIIFRFTAVFLAVYYYAFFSNYDTDQSYMRISVTIFSLMTAGQWTGAFIDICVPSILHRINLYRMKVSISATNKQLYKAKDHADDRKHKLWVHEQRNFANNRKSGSTDGGAKSTESQVSSDRNSDSSTLSSSPSQSDGGSSTRNSSGHFDLPSLDSLEDGTGDIHYTHNYSGELENASEQRHSFFSALRFPSLGGSWSGRRPSSTSSRTSYWGGGHLGFWSRRYSDKSNESIMSKDAISRETRAIEVLDEAIDRRGKYLDHAKSGCWEEALMPSYRSFTDYSTAIVQLGFVVFFSPVFPLAPLIALINNLCLIRLGAFKMCYTRQRPIASKTSGIGVWEDLLQIMSVIAIVTNCCIMGLTSRQLRALLPTLGDMSLAVGLFLLEHALLLFKYWLHSSVPRYPASVHRAMARDQVQRDQHVREKRRRSRHKEKGRFDDNGNSHFDGDDNYLSPVVSKEDIASNAVEDSDDRPIHPQNPAMDLESLFDEGTTTSASLSPPGGRRTVRFAEDTIDAEARDSSKKSSYRRSSLCVRSKMGLEAARKSYHPDSSSDSSDDDTDTKLNEEDQFGPRKRGRASWLENSPYNASTMVQQPRTQSPTLQGRAFSPTIQNNSVQSASTFPAALKNQQDRAEAIAASAAVAESAAAAIQETNRSLSRAPSWDATSFLEKLGEIRKAAEHVSPVRTQPTARQQSISKTTDVPTEVNKERDSLEVPVWACPGDNTVSTASVGETADERPIKPASAQYTEILESDSAAVLLIADPPDVKPRAKTAATLKREKEKEFKKEREKEKKAAAAERLKAKKEEAAALAAAAAAVVPRPSTSLRGQTLDEKLRSIDALVAGTVSFVDSIAAGRAQRTPIADKSNPFERLVNESTLPTAEDAPTDAIQTNDSQESRATTSPRRGGRITRGNTSQQTTPKRSGLRSGGPVSVQLSENDSTTPKRSGLRSGGPVSVQLSENDSTVANRKTRSTTELSPVPLPVGLAGDGNRAGKEKDKDRSASNPFSFAC